MLKQIVLILATVTIISAKKDPLQKFTEGNKRFAASSYKQVLTQNENKNFLVSPFSAETVLSLAQSGAKGKTAKEIRRALHLSNKTEEIASVFRNLLTTLKSEAYTLRTANKIYIKQDYPIKKNFSSVAKDVYQSTAENIDFAKSGEAARTINGWVSEQTENKIQDLISSESLNEDTVAVLVNALYFQANWRKQFKKTLTQKRDFYKSEDDVVEVETMKKHDLFGYFESEDLGAKFLQMPFRGSHVHMVVVLPNEKNGLEEVEKKIEKVFVSPTFAWEFVEVTLPKFKIETSIDYKSILKKLGVKRAFTRADFSGIGGSKGEIHISDVVQKTYISVDENGVEAAAATAVSFHAKSLIEYNGEKKVFKADHPFLFYITINDIVIFTGRVVSPSL